MTFTLTDGENWKKTLKFEIPYAEVELKYGESLKQATRIFVLPGFRPGRVPAAMVEKKYGPQIIEESKENARMEAFETAIKELNIHVIGMPNFTEEYFAKGEPYRFSADFETEPVFEMPSYKGLKIDRYRVVVTDAEVDEEIRSMSFRSSEWVDEAGREAHEKDAITCDMSVNMEGAEVERRAAERIIVANHSLKDFKIDNLVEKLLGLKAGDEREFICHYAKAHPDKEKAGNEVTLKFHVSNVAALKTPEANDELAKTWGFTDLADLRSNLKTRIELYKSEREEQRIRRAVVDKLLENVNFNAPENLMQRETAAQLRKLKMRFLRMGIDIETLDDGKKLDEFAKSAARDAERSIREFFAFEKIAEAEKVFTTEGEVVREVEVLAHSYKMAPAKMRAHLEKNGLIEEIRHELRERKITELLLAKAEVTEIDAPPEPAMPEHVHDEHCDHSHDE